MDATLRGTENSLREKSMSLRSGGRWLEIMEELLVSAIFDLLKLA
jgi:hypothetical protein